MIYVHGIFGFVTQKKPLHAILVYVLEQAITQQCCKSEALGSVYCAVPEKNPPLRVPYGTPLLLHRNPKSAIWHCCSCQVLTNQKHCYSGPYVARAPQPSDLESNNRSEIAENDTSVSSVNTEDLLDLDFSEDNEENGEILWSCDRAPVNVTPFTMRAGAESGVAEDSTAKDFSSSLFPMNCLNCLNPWSCVHEDSNAQRQI